MRRDTRIAREKVISAAEKKLSLLSSAVLQPKMRAQRPLQARLRRLQSHRDYMLVYRRAKSLPRPRWPSTTDDLSPASKVISRTHGGEIIVKRVFVKEEIRISPESIRRPKKCGRGDARNSAIRTNQYNVHFRKRRRIIRRPTCFKIYRDMSYIPI